MSVPTASKGSVSRIVDLVRVLGAKTLSGIDAIGGMTIFMVRGLFQIFANIRIIPRTIRSEERREGKECPSLCSWRWAPGG